MLPAHAVRRYQDPPRPSARAAARQVIENASKPRETVTTASRPNSVQGEEEPTDSELAVHLAGGTSRHYRQLSQPFGKNEDWLDLPPQAWRKAGWPATWCDRMAPWRQREALSRERQRARNKGIRLLGSRGRSYPRWLREIPDLPLALCVRGRWPPPEEALSIVGARAATPTGRQMARACGEAAARAGVAVVSGLARGVDRCALEGTLDTGGWPLGVLGCGIDVVYPPENTAVQEAVARSGTLISEFPLGARPTRYNFPRRNRVIAALCRQLLVVEAGRKSGALITARYALELGRDVWVVPGAVDSPQSIGSNELLYDGAQPVIDPARLPEMLGIFSHGPRESVETEPLLVTLGRRALTPDEIAEELQLSAHKVRSRLIALELEGRITCSAGGRYLKI